MTAERRSGRSSGRVVNLAASGLVTAQKGVGSSNDSQAVLPAARRLSAAEAEQIIGQLSALERDVVLALARVRLASGQQLRRLFFPPTLSGQRQARRLLLHLTERRVLARLGRTIGGRRAGSAGFVYSLDVVGQRLVRPDDDWRRPWTPGQAFVAHAVAVSECYVGLVEGERAGQWTLLDFTTEPACWRSFVSRRGRASLLKPDAYARVALGDYEDRWFFEVDRGSEDLGRIRRKALVYVDYWHSGREPVFPRVLWLVNRPARRDALTGALASGLPADAWQLFQVCLADDFGAVIAAGAEPDGQHVNEGGET